MKRLFDIIAAVLALLVLSPLFLILYVLVRINLGPPAIFRQQRPGLHGVPFELLKFRSMMNAQGTEEGLLPDDLRLTPFGKFLRNSSLDELLELVNVLKGEMSLVGPRPLLMEYLDHYSPAQARRHEVRPGITGWAQIKGRNAISWEEKFELDVWYVDNQSFWLDIKILIITLWKIIKREGINQPGQATAAKFGGS